jgi:hypothetical protein
MLFDFKETKTDTNKLDMLTNNHSAYFISSQNDYLSKYLKNYKLSESNDVIHFTSNGRFALHDIIIYYADKLKQADVIVSSFNISTEASRKFIRAWDFGKFKSLRFILNKQKRSNFRKAINIIENKFIIA